MLMPAGLWTLLALAATALVAATDARASTWCALSFAAPLSLRVRGLLCATLECSACDVTCVGRIDWTTVSVPRVALDRSAVARDRVRELGATVTCPAEDGAGAGVHLSPGTQTHPDAIVVELRPGFEDLEGRMRMWHGAVPACTFERIGAEAVVRITGCAWDTLRPIWPSIAIARERSGPRVRPVQSPPPPPPSSKTTPLAPGLLNRWSAAGLRFELPAGLDGTGQVLGSIDTGVSVGACYIRGTQTVVPYVECGTSGVPPSGGDADLSIPSLRKVVQYVRSASGSSQACGSAGDADGHGTHTASTAVGAPLCAGSPCPSVMHEFAGVATGAKLAVFDAGPDTDGYLLLPGDVAHAFDWGRRAGAAVHVNSWGARSGGVYTDLDYSADWFAHTHPEAVMVVSAGNNGEDPADPHVTSLGLAKNALTVGAAYSTADARRAVFCGGMSAYAPSSFYCTAINSEPQGQTASFSARGSVSGAGRIKPDLVAVGDAVWSARNTDQCNAAVQSPYFWDVAAVRPMIGTSMAAPHVAGAALLVRQFFAHGFYPCGVAASGRNWSTVPSALVRATLVLAADASHLPPSLPRGYGAIDSLSDLLGGSNAPSSQPPVVVVVVVAGGPPSAPSATPWDGLASAPRMNATGVTHVYSLCATAAALRVVLAWTDPPTFVDDPTSGLLVNDLDLTVLIGNTTLRGNGARDRVSTLETVGMSDLAPGTTVTVQVAARRIASIGQGWLGQAYALVAQGAAETCDPVPAGCGGGGGGGAEAGAPTAAPTLPPPSASVHSIIIFMDGGYNASMLTHEGSLNTGATVWFEVEIGGPAPIYVASVVAPQTACNGSVPIPSEPGWVYGPALHIDTDAVGEEAAAEVTLSFAGLADGTMYWRSQRLVYCAENGTQWADVTSACRQRLQHESVAPVRVCGSGAPGGTFALVDRHDTSRWDVVCAPGGWSGCACERSSPWGRWGVAFLVPAAAFVSFSAAWVALKWFPRHLGPAAAALVGLSRFADRDAAIVAAVATLLFAVTRICTCVAARRNKQSGEGEEGKSWWSASLGLADPSLVAGVVLAAAACMREAYAQAEDSAVHPAAFDQTAPVALLLVTAAAAFDPRVSRTALCVLLAAGGASLHHAFVYSTLAFVAVQAIPARSAVYLQSALDLVTCGGFALAFLYAPCTEMYEW